MYAILSSWDDPREIFILRFQNTQSQMHIASCYCTDRCVYVILTLTLYVILTFCCTTACFIKFFIHLIYNLSDNFTLAISLLMFLIASHQIHSHRYAQAPCYEQFWVEKEGGAFRAQCLIYGK